ncbi:hypothetical protein ACFW3D_16060 [Streptomyces sp. NPDC058864]
MHGGGHVGVDGPRRSAGSVAHGSGEPGDTTLAFCLGAALKTLAVLVAAAVGVRAERRGTESLAAPLSAVEEPAGTSGATGARS